MMMEWEDLAGLMRKYGQVREADYLDEVFEGLKDFKMFGLAIHFTGEQCDISLDSVDFRAGKEFKYDTSVSVHIDFLYAPNEWEATIYRLGKESVIVGNDGALVAKIIMSCQQAWLEEESQC